MMMSITRLMWVTLHWLRDREVVSERSFPYIHGRCIRRLACRYGFKAGCSLDLHCGRNDCTNDQVSCSTYYLGKTRVASELERQLEM